MQALTTYSTAKGAKIELFAAAAGKINVHANGKWIGVMAGLVDSAANGKVIALVGQATVVTVGAALADVEAAISAAKQQAGEAAQKADQHWTAYAATPEGKAEALLVKIDRQESED